MCDACLPGFAKGLAPSRTRVGGGGGLILEEEPSRMCVPVLLPHLCGGVIQTSFSVSPLDLPA